MHHDNTPYSLVETRCRTLFLFALLFLYLLTIGQLSQPSVHRFFDAVGTRDAAVYLASRPLAWTGFVDFVYQTLSHVEGPLQFISLNLYALLIGYWLPLNPATMQIPNVFFVLLAAGAAYSLGSRLVSTRFGLCFALVLALEPWVANTIRINSFLHTECQLTHAIVVMTFTSWFLDPQSTKWRVLAPASLALYLLNGLDWVAFLFFLFSFAIASGRLRLFVLNVFNLLPLSVVAVYLWWAWHLYSAGNDSYTSNVLFLALRKSESYAKLDFAAMSHWLIWSIGLGFVMSVAAVAVTARDFTAVVRRLLFKTKSLDNLQRVFWGLFFAMVVWLFGALIPLLAASRTGNYGYMIGLPVAFLSALFLYRLDGRIVSVLVLAMVGWQLSLVGPLIKRYYNYDDRRTLAVATYLIEDRPDLLQVGKVAFLPRNLPANIGQYARGAQTSIIMPLLYPKSRSHTAVGSLPGIMDPFLDGFEQRGEILADWLILSPEQMNSAAGDFYARLSKHPNVSWIGRFKDKHDQEVWLGEVAPNGTPLHEAPIIQVEPLANKYSEKYDYLPFLTRNIDLLLRY